jgi:hypothetical protein
MRGAGEFPVGCVFAIGLRAENVLFGGGLA